MENRIPVITAIGEVLWDIFPDGKYLGGAPFNVVCNTSQLGIKSTIASSVGDDSLGREILDAIEKKGVNAECMTIDTEHPTGTVSVALDENGKPDFTIHKNVAWDFLEWNSRLSMLAQISDAIVFGSLAQRSPKSRETIIQFIQSAPKSCIRVFDINLRQSYYSKEIIEESLILSEILKLNDDELPVVSSLFDINGNTLEVIRHLISKYSLRLVALTRGSKGSLLVQNGEESDHQGLKVDVFDTVGAGDAFTAAVIVGALKGKSLDEINETANRLASHVCTQRGALPPIPDSIRELFNS